MGRIGSGGEGLGTREKKRIFDWDVKTKINKQKDKFEIYFKCFP